ncbi:glutamate racemase [Robiginitalea marina]|uniref:Glutamate racemase n=1 Tax=Robiginitalea marina TaxID=2954105 RepID=A0ABT1AXN5_9FLAO|nr:glutamate racemase [Robiginitalea marina]MCO5724689.1 glutamate racemase [Robiginitalea marina]
MKDAPIGFFDSGLGGLTVREEVMRLLPGEHTCYFADSANAPYGEKAPLEILELSRRNTRWLLGMGCKMVVVACNTATTNAIAQLREEFPVPFIGIEPAIKPAALQSETGRVGVLATRGTLSSSLFASTTRNFASGITVMEQEGYGLVRLIESGKLDAPETRDHLEQLLQPMIRAGIDHLVLGCTHYPLLIPHLREILPVGVRIVDPGPAVARQTRAVLEQHGLLRLADGPARHAVYTSGNLAVANQMLSRLGHPPRALPVQG